MYNKIIILMFLIGLSGFFSASETALTAFKSNDLQGIRGTRAAELLKKWMKNPNEMLTGILLGNNIVNISASSIATALTLTLIGNSGRAIAMATVSMTAVILIFGEITPKIMAKSSSGRAAKAVILPIYYLSIITAPLIKVLVSASKVVGRLFGVHIGSEAVMITQKDIISYINVGEVEGVIERGEKNMIHSIFELGETTAREVMTPRISMFALRWDRPIDEVWEEIRAGGFSRIPVYGRGGIDNVIGILYLKDLLDIVKSGGKGMTVGEILRSAYFIPEGKPVMDIFREFKRRKVHIAVVLDEYGGTAGVLTIEDLIEEIVGEIQDEHDRDEDIHIRESEEGGYEVNAALPIDTLYRELGIRVVKSERYESLGGFLMETLGRGAGVGDSVRIGVTEITVAEMDRIRVSKVMIRKAAGEEDEK